MRGIGKNKDKDKEKMPTRGSHRRSNVRGSVEEGKEVAAAEGVEEVETSEELETITMDVCENWLNESHTILRDMLVRFNEGLTPLGLDALVNGLKCVELVLKDEDMMAMYHSDAMDMAEEAKKAEAKGKRKQQK